MNGIINGTFNIPNYNDRVPQGGIAGYKEAGLPNLKYQFRNASGNGEYGTAQILTDNGSSGKTITLSSGYIYSDGINIVGNSTTVQPPACLSKFIIKY